MMEAMNITTADYFTFNVDNSLLLVGQTGSGKSYLVHQMVKRYESTFSANQMKYAFFDLKQVEFNPNYEGGAKPEYLLFDVEEGLAPDYGFNRLDELVSLSKQRSENNITKPFIFIYIEECDMARRDQNRFDEAVIAINQNAKSTNMKLIYSTSAPHLESVSDKLLCSFDLILASYLDDDYYKLLGIPKVDNMGPYGFVVTAQADRVSVSL